MLSDSVKEKPGGQHGHSGDESCDSVHSVQTITDITMSQLSLLDNTPSEVMSVIFPAYSVTFISHPFIQNEILS